MFAHEPKSSARVDRPDPIESDAAAFMTGVTQMRYERGRRRSDDMFAGIAEERTPGRDEEAERLAVEQAGQTATRAKPIDPTSTGTDATDELSRGSMRGETARCAGKWLNDRATLEDVM